MELFQTIGICVGSLALVVIAFCLVLLTVSLGGILLPLNELSNMRNRRGDFDIIEDDDEE